MSPPVDSVFLNGAPNESPLSPAPELPVEGDEESNPSKGLMNIFFAVDPDDPNEEENDPVLCFFLPSPPIQLEADPRRPEGPSDSASSESSSPSLSETA
jgi:hypothetical protein